MADEVRTAKLVNEIEYKTTGAAKAKQGLADMQKGLKESEKAAKAFAGAIAELGKKETKAYDQMAMAANKLSKAEQKAAKWRAWENSKTMRQNKRDPWTREKWMQFKSGHYMNYQNNVRGGKGLFSENKQPSLASLVNLGLDIKNYKNSIEANAARYTGAETNAAFYGGKEFSSGGGMLGMLKSKIPTMTNGLTGESLSGEGLKTALSTAATLGKAASKVIGEMAVGFVRASTGAAKLLYNITPIHKAINGIGRALKSVSTLGKRIGRIALYRAIRSAIKEIAKGFQEGVQNLYQWSSLTGGKFAESMNAAATSLQYLKNSVGAMVAPLVNALAPVLDALVDKFVNLINLVNQFVATISGASSWTKALKYGTEYAETTAAGAKAVQKQLLGFDEINRLNDNSGSGGSSALDYSKMFEEQALQGGGFAEMLKRAIEGENWEGVGTLFGNKLNSLFREINLKDAAFTLGEKINNVVEGVNAFFDRTSWSTLSKSIAEGLNTLIDTVNPRGLAILLTQKINTVIDLVSGFVENFQWKQAGDWLGTLIDTWFGNINWSGLETTIATTINGVFDFAKSFISNIQWGEHAKNIAEYLNKLVQDINWDGISSTVDSCVNGVIEGAKTFVTDFNWEEFGSKTAKCISDMLTGINWDGLGETLNELVQGLLDGAIAFVRDVDWEQVGIDIYNFISQIDFVDIFLKIGKLVTSAIQGMARAISSALESSGLNNNGKGSTVGISDHGNNGAISLTSSKATKTTLRANGGYVDSGSMFIAGESGAEFVGNINGRTGVMNTDQFGAVMQPTTEAIYAIGSAIVGAVNGIEMPSVRIGDRDIYRASERGKRLTGSSLVQGAR